MRESLACLPEKQGTNKLLLHYIISPKNLQGKLETYTISHVISGIQRKEKESQ